MKKTSLLKSTLLLFALIVGSMNAWADKITDYNNIVSGQKYYIGATTGSNDYYLSVDGSSTSTSIAGTAVTDKSNATAFTFSGSSTSWTIRFESGYYLSLNNSKDNGKVQVVSSASTFTLSNQSENKIRLTIGNYSVQKNNSGIQFGSYANTQTDVWLEPVANADPSTVATPTFSPGGGTYTTAKDITITCATDGATIHYTTNGNDPTESDATYSSAISVTTSGTTLKAKAFKDGMTASSVASATYTIKPNTPTITAVGATVTITGDDGCTFYYTTNGDAPTSSSTEYTAPFEQLTDCTIKAIAYDAYGNASGVKSYTFKYMPLSPKSVNSGYYVKVTNVSDLENGDAILIVNEGAGKALGGQSGNNCPAKDVTITDGTISNIGEAQKLILVKKTEEISEIDTEVFYFYTGSAYLYAASSSNNYLKTQTVPDDDGNARATISISSGDATITFKGNYTHNLLKYNSSSTLFSCYASGQTAVQIYKEVPAEPSTPVDNGDNTITLTTTADMDGWRSFYDKTQAYEVDANTSIYTVSAAEGTTVTLNKVAGTVVPANSPVILKTTDAGHSMTLTETTDDATLGSNILAVTDGTSDADGYRLGYGAEDGIAFYKYVATKPAAGIVYIPKGSISAPTLTIEFGETTGIDASLMNNEVMNNEYYNLNGQRVAQPTKGLYIVNGKKYVVK